MTQLPPEIQSVLRLFHETIDQQFDRQLRRLEEERRDKHEEADKFLENWLEWLKSTSVPPAVSPAPAAPPPDVPPAGTGRVSTHTATLFSENGAKNNGNGNGNGSERKQLFPLQETIRKIIEDSPDDTGIDQQSLYARLIHDHPILRERVEGHLRGQIIGVLNKLAKTGFIRLYRKGTGSSPHIYKKATADEAVAV